MIFNILLVAGVALLSVALRSFRHALLHRMGTVGILLTSFLAGWLFSGQLWVGALFAGSWLLLPWVEIFTRIRHLRLPIERTLRHRTPPSNNAFPGLDEITQEIEDEGFEYVEDTGWDHESYQHFYRLFYHSEKCMQATICLVEQNDMAFYYVSLLTRKRESDQEYVTWNYPFSYSLRFVPSWHLNRLSGDVSFKELLTSHEEFLQAEALRVSDIANLSPEEFKADLQAAMRKQVVHNLDRGLLIRDGEHMIRYSLRGMFFLWLQFLRDLVRLS